MNYYILGARLLGKPLEIIPFCRLYPFWFGGISSFSMSSSTYSSDSYEGKRERERENETDR